MALGKINECWICYQLEKCRNPNFKHICTPVKGKKGTMVEGCIMWLCKNCR